MAGRPERPIDPDSAPAIRRLAERLRRLRDAAGLSYRQMAERSGFSAATLSRAAGGVIVPGQAVVLAIAEALELQENERAELVELHRAAELEQDAKRNTEPVHSRPMVPSYIMWPLHEALVDLYDAAGRPPLRTVESLSGISRSTLHRSLTDWRDSGGRKHQIAQVLMRLVEPGRRGAFLETFRSQVYTAQWSEPDAAADEALPNEAVARAGAPLARLAQCVDRLEQQLVDDEAMAEDIASLLDGMQRSIDTLRQSLPSRFRSSPGIGQTQQSTDRSE